MKAACPLIALAAVLSAGCPQQVLAKPRTSLAAEKTDTLSALPILSVSKDGRVMARVPAPDRDGTASTFLHVVTLKTGIGSSDVGLDRASIADTQLTLVRKFGNKVVVQYGDPRLRAGGAPAYGVDAVASSFARRTILVADIAAVHPDGGFSFDLTPMFTKDGSELAQALAGNSSSTYTLLEDVSALDPGSLRTFPRNAEIDTLLTFEAARERPEIPGPAGKRVTLEVHHSFVRLPPPGYAARALDPRIGGIATPFLDFNAPLGSPVVGELASRFRLEKTDPQAPRSRVVDPIVFYVDREAPEPIRTALVEGASWWKEAFEAAGYIDAFDVRVMPPDIDPMDIRFNVINWVNRETRGWSYGQAIADPRTGEIIKGSVLLGSLRVRQDLLIFDALQVGDEAGKRAALARIRQLAAHEVGHALGLEHNFAGSGQQRSSVMDYPAPRVELVDGALSVADAYGVGLGAWDRFAIRWLYGKEADDPRVANDMLEQSQAEGLAFVGDDDARPLSSANPAGSLWDDGSDPADELLRVLSVREAAVASFSAKSVRPGRSHAELQRAFVPVWLLHRYQVEAAAKLVGGFRYSYGVAGAQPERVAQPVAPADQVRAIDALLQAMDAKRLTVPTGLALQLTGFPAASRDPQYGREVFQPAGPGIFDPFVATEVGAQIVLEALLDPARLSRASAQKAADPAQPGAGEIIERVITSATAGLDQPAGRRIAYRAVMTLARLEGTSDPEVALLASGTLDRLAGRLRAEHGTAASGLWKVEMADLIRDRARLRERLLEAKPPTVPPGMPIG